MSLQVWLPLDGDLRNQGLSPIAVTNFGATIDNNGKIGKCYNFNGVDNYIQLNNYDMSNWSEYSITCWVKPLANFNNLFLVRENTNHQIRIASNGLSFRDSNNPTIRTVALGQNINTNEWTHLCCIYKQGEVFFYQNGIQTAHNTTYYNSNSYTNNNCTEIRIGRSQSSSGDGYFNGLINDFRIYDHALSVKEIKELAKGLILHYKLNKPLHTNLLTIKPKSHNATAYNAYQLNLLENLQSGQTYTLQLWDVDVSHSAKTVAQTGVWVYWGGGSISLFNWAGSSHFTNGHANYLVKTFTVTAANASGSGAANAWLNIYNSVGNASGTRNLTIGAWKLEKGSIATPFDIGVNDPAYAVAGYSAGIEPDCSGYKRDGIITGTITGNANTPRYRTCSYFNGSSYMNITNPFDINTLIKDFSISCWIKKDYLDNNERAIYNGIIKLYIYTDGKLRITWNHASNDLSYNSGNTWACGILIPNNEWVYIVYTFSNGIIKVYKDGEYVSTSNRSNTGNNIRGYRGTTFNMSDSTQAFIGNVSDFRIYCTALSADDIQALYKDAGYIDKNNNFYAYEYVENGINSPQISKKGVFYIPEEIKEDNNYQANIDELNIYTNHEFYEL